ncbi:quinone oxidoreductase family protein [Paenibacillus konkukensis]|nr:quinone oxidoreductase [Paenibacillus konkukensis]
MKALMFERFGGPEVLYYAEAPDPPMKPGTALVRMKAAGLNFADIYRRRGGYYLAGDPPYILGYEGAGIVEQVSSDLDGIRAGDRVAFADVPFANAELVSAPADRLIPLPYDISFEQAAAILLQGLTAHYLVHDSYHVRPGDDVVIHAAAGGVGQLLIQMSKNKGARVAGITSSNAKREAALKAGADEVLFYDDDWVHDVIGWSQSGCGANVVYDSIGSTLMNSFAAVQTKGTVVFFGMAGGDPPNIDPRMLMDSSKSLVGGDLWNHLTTRNQRLERAETLFADLRMGRLELEEPKQFALEDGEAAHRLLEGRGNTGKILLIP